MQAETKTALRISRVISASQQAVFDAWTKPKLIKQWSCPAGATVAESVADVVVGGAYRLRMEIPEGGVHTAHGIYQEVTPPSRLVYTWDWEEAPMGDTHVTVTFTDLGDATEVVVEHERFPAEEATVNHEQGWSSCLDQLTALFGPTA